MKAVVPPRLEPGDPVGICAPAGRVDGDRLDRGVSWLEARGHAAVLGKNLRARHGYLAGTDAQRASDLRKMISPKAPSVLIFARGGYGVTRILDRLDLDGLRRHPKLLVGYSDLTALFMALQRPGPYPVLYGPMASELGDPESFDRESLLGALSGRVRTPAVRFRQTDVLRAGVADGRLLGGCLSLLVSILGTPWDTDYAGSILFWEEIGEPPFRIDRMLTQLRNAGKLERIRGMVIGSLSGCEPTPGRPSLPMRRAILEALGPGRYPVIWNLRAGHVARKITLPLGVRGKLDTGTGRLVVDWPPVRPRRASVG